MRTTEVEIKKIQITIIVIIMTQNIDRMTDWEYKKLSFEKENILEP